MYKLSGTIFFYATKDSENQSELFETFELGNSFKIFVIEPEPLLCSFFASDSPFFFVFLHRRFF
jgi:hypothetical protein